MAGTVPVKSLNINIFMINFLLLSADKSSWGCWGCSGVTLTSPHVSITSLHTRGVSSDAYRDGSMRHATRLQRQDGLCDPAAWTPLITSFSLWTRVITRPTRCSRHKRLSFHRQPFSLHPSVFQTNPRNRDGMREERWLADGYSSFLCMFHF